MEYTKKCYDCSQQWAKLSRLCTWSTLRTGREDRATMTYLGQKIPPKRCLAYHSVFPLTS